MLYAIFIIVFVIIISSAIKNANANKNKEGESEQNKNERLNSERRTGGSQKSAKSLYDFKQNDSSKLEEELFRREGFDEQEHDYTCKEDDCDGCGSDDVYAQVYGKRKNNKLNKK